MGEARAGLVNTDLSLPTARESCTSGNRITTVDSTGDVGLFTTVALDGGGNPVIAYYDQPDGDLELARVVNTP
ncbi:MAG: hypothetical protein ACE5GC_07980 [Acidimicrobiia bacterium]